MRVCRRSCTENKERDLVLAFWYWSMHDQGSASHHSEIIAKGMSKGMMVLWLIEFFVESDCFLFSHWTRKSSCIVTVANVMNSAHRDTVLSTPVKQMLLSLSLIYHTLARQEYDIKTVVHFDSELALEIQCHLEESTKGTADHHQFFTGKHNLCSCISAIYTCYRASSQIL